ncbi:ribonuclease HII [Oscillatoria sp. FACHB-1406]|uniref:ribonuclease HII n=1 Tax=Oscillatoria sp. FACHB-1406 TaxID=2692846 RepID=UPI001688D4DF|nr:ribonuclease HII [Oscillatoria sp. FACHB-1406]MBD2576783.1 ribonuclease HII [Oscillatoria sp. FACHB-1406]
MSESLGGDRVAGVDEVGRGAWFGPVVAAAVILPPSVWPDLAIAGVKDSKQLSPKKRVELSQMICAIALDVKIGWATAREIDRINIFQASLLAMKRAILQLQPPPQQCLIDGRFPVPNLCIPQETLIGGDRQSLVIAAASIVAKVWRDELLIRLEQKYPDYDLASNKGYGTPRHRLGLQQHGPSSQHRLSFQPCRRDRST